MKLIRVEGNIRLQRALSHSYVQTIVDILLQHRDTLGFVAEVLQKYMQPAEAGLTKSLAAIRNSYSQLDAEGNTIVPKHIVILTETLDKLYLQNREKITDQRGAIVELFVRKLVCPRYSSEVECSNSRGFVDDQNRPITSQEVDVAALSHTRRHIEAYECKLKAHGLTSDDCVDLAYLLKTALESGYRANIGIASFDSDNAVRRRLNHLRPVIEHILVPSNIKAYGLESIGKLQHTPF